MARSDTTRTHACECMRAMIGCELFGGKVDRSTSSLDKVADYPEVQVSLWRQPRGALRLRQLPHRRLCQPSLSNLLPHIMQGRSLGASPSARARPACSNSPSISAGTALVRCSSGLVSLTTCFLSDDAPRGLRHDFQRLRHKGARAITLHLSGHPQSQVEFLPDLEKLGMSA